MNKKALPLPQPTERITALLWALWGIFALAPIMVIAMWFTGTASSVISTPLAFAALLCLAPLGLSVVVYRRMQIDKARLERRICGLIAELELSQDELWEKYAQDQRLEKAENSNRAKSRFLATVSHEIRTPLNGILGMSDLLSETPLSADQNVYNDAIRKSGSALLSLINDILDFSKIEAGQLTLVANDISLAALLEQTAELLAPRAYEKGIDLATYVDPSLPASIHLDGERLRQVLFNLIGNAIKFTADGGILVSAMRREQGILFSVRDSGIGITNEAKERIFQEFEQADEGTARAFGGTGLGLAISRHIVSAFGGTLNVQSTAGTGSCFEFEIKTRLPLAPGRSDVFAGYSLLHIGPENAEAEVFARHVRDNGGGLTRARTLAEAQAKMAAAEAANENFDVITLDGRLIDRPVDAMAALKEATIKIAPCLVLLSPRDRRTLDAIKKAGFQSYLMRPIRAASLRRVIVDLISPRPQKRPLFIADPADSKRPKKAKNRSTAKPQQVLLVEDNTINALLSRALLEREGWLVECAENGQEAVEFLRTGKSFDLILMDLHMPGMDGLQATQIIREIERNANRAPTTIIALTADATDEARDAALRASMNTVLTKPIDIDLFRQEIRKIKQTADNFEYKTVTKR